MRKTMSITLVLVLALSVSAFAKPVDNSGALEKFQYMDLSGTGKDFVGTSSLGVFGSAQAGTTFYGGTVWAADSGRWEAIEDSIWTFDTGVGSDLVGSSSNPFVDPNKLAGLHATMEGWTGYDNSYSEITFFRRVSDADARWGADVCVGATAGLGGNWSYWCGAFPAEADFECYAAGQGYGDNWNVCIGKTLAYNGTGVTLTYDYVNETESGFDFSSVVVDTSGAGDDVTVIEYDGGLSGSESLSLSPGIEVPVGAGNVIVKFCFASDGAWSDQDGQNPTTCGAFAVDNVALSGGISDGPSTFETSDDGWVLQPAAPGAGGEWSNIVDLGDLPPPLTDCVCILEDSVLVFDDISLGTGHGLYQDNLAASPWIDLGPDGYNNAGPGKLININLYAELPLLNYIFVQFNIQWYPQVCINTGALIRSAWTSNGFVYYFGGVPQCTQFMQRGNANDPTQIDFSAIVDPGAEQVRIALGVLSYCRFFGNCTGVSNSTPWIDYAALGVYGDPNAPAISTSTIDIPQDNFPENGTLNANAPGRLDSNNVIGDSQPEIGTALGDTLIIEGGTGGAHVYVEFAVTPGPGVDPVAFNNWLTSHTFEGSYNGQDWYSARVDTAQRGTPVAGLWMTTYHEEDPNFTGSDTDTDPNDLDPNGGQTRLLNDIFPDNMFTAGTRVNLFYRAQFVDGSGVPINTSWGFSPNDTSGGNVYEWECLPSSFDGSAEFNCILYVDHFSGRGAQPFIETALENILGVGGGSNWEGTLWDRYDVQAPSSQQASYGRPLQTEYGATIVQTLGYKAIVWNSGNLNAFNLTKEDADVLLPWLTLGLVDANLDFNNIYFSGDGIIFSPIFESESEPSARALMEDHAGATLATGCETGTYRDLGCPTGKAKDSKPCVNLDPVSGGLGDGTRLVVHTGQGNGCPQQRSFDVAAANPADFGIPATDEIYVGDESHPDAYASVRNDAGLAGGLNFRIVTDGVSVHYRRDASGACDFNTPPGTVASVTERMTEVMTWLGYDTGQLCSDPTAGIGIGDDPRTPPTFKTTLANFAPNPLMTGATGRIQFTMAREGKANVDIFDVNGRLVKSVYDGIANEGINEAFWNGTDGTGRDVASGVYFYRLRAGAEDFSKKMVVVRNGGK